MVNQDDFWRLYGNMPNGHNFALTLLVRMLYYDDFSNLHWSKIENVLRDAKNRLDLSEEDFKAAVTKITKELEGLKRIIANDLPKIQARLLNEYAEDRAKKLKTKPLPEFAIESDDKLTLKFLNSLDKPHYSFNQLADILARYPKMKGTTRSTLKQNVLNGKLQAKLTKINKADVLLREEVVKIFRQLHNKYYEREISYIGKDGSYYFH